ncbi:hypothetical protein GXB85_16345 [Cellulomonas sp. APG4]|uniref:hypothetical protein n=1 Tax=Cellulomonas sp. APG4 TaxID=1538656 RepID=UPI00137B554A|nr:hypothetical protein [Cellulomonas sp. APG4]NCT92507.1 hypothetical protein [Cellulomonas sp. APG4]
MNRALVAAGGVLMLGGLVIGGLPMPLAGFDCPAAFAASPTELQDIETLVACAQMRAERQDVGLGLIVLGAAAATGGALHRRELASAPAPRTTAASGLGKG